MKIKHLLTKTLLVAAGLLVGASNVWAYVVPSGYEVKNVFFGTDNGDNTVTAEDFATTTAAGWSLIDFSSDANNSIGISIISEVVKPEVGSTAEGVPTYVAGNCIDLKARDRQGHIKYAGYSFASVSSGYLVFDADIFGDGNYPTYIKFVDSEGNAVLTMHWADGNQNAARNFYYQVGASDEVSTGIGGKPRDYHGYGIRDLVIDLGTGATSFKLDYITWKSGAAGDRAVSDAIELNIGTGKNIAGIQLGYVFNSGNSNVTQHSYMDNIKLYTVGVETPSYTYTIKAKAGSTDLGTMATGSCKGGMSFSATGLPYVIKNGGKYYVLTDAGVSNFMKSYSMEADGSNKDQEIEYTLDNTIVFYAELEDLGNHGGTSEGNYSNGSNAPIAGGKYSELDELPRGVYSVTAAVNDRPDRGMIIRSAQSIATENELAYVTTATAGIMSGEFSLYENTTVYLSGITNGSNVNQSATMDYIVIRKTADIPTSINTLAIPTSTYATISSAYALDFANATDGSSAKTLKAYVVSNLSATSATLTEVTEAPANTGIILMGTAGETYTIPVLATASPVGTNKLHASVTPTLLADGTFYVLKGGKFLLVTGTADDAARTVPAGKAYLLASDMPAPAPELTINFGGEATGIADVRGKMEDVRSDFFDLQGRKVAQPTKGLYIQNGRKVILK